MKILDHMVELKKEGKIKAIGFSFHEAYDLFINITDSFEWDAVQIQFNYIDTNFQAGIKGLNYVTEKKIPLIIMEPLHGGSLVKTNATIDTIINSTRPKRTLADWGLRYVWDHPGVSVIISGMNTIEMVEENIKTSESALPNSMNQSDFDTIGKLKEVFSKNIKIPCSFCEYCMPCPSGVCIPLNFNILNNQSWDLKDTYSKLEYESLAKTKEDLIESPNHGNAGLCEKYGQCIQNCPQKINIPIELEKIYNIFSVKEDFHKYY